MLITADKEFDKIMTKIMMGIDRDIRRILHGGIVKSICHAVLFFRE